MHWTRPGLDNNMMSSNVVPVFAGNYWIYSTYGDWSQTQGHDNYCHPTLYWFAFWLLTVGYIIFGAIICCGCVIACCRICCGSLLESCLSKCASDDE